MTYRYHAELKLTCLTCGKTLAIRTSSAIDLPTTMKMITSANYDDVEHDHGCAVKESIKE